VVESSPEINLMMKDLKAASDLLFLKYVNDEYHPNRLYNLVVIRIRDSYTNISPALSIRLRYS